jgi:hypothetical protein
MKQFSKITQSQISAKGVQALADKPNSTAQYGTGGFSSTQLKLWFDKLATFLADKINELYATLESDQAGEYIKIPLDPLNIDTLNALLESFSNGIFASQVLELYPNAYATEKQTLQNIISAMAENDDVANNYISGLMSTSASYITVETTFDNLAYIKVFNSSGALLTDVSIDLNVSTSRLIDESVTTSKIADGAITEGKIATGAVTTNKIGKNAVTGDKIANGSITEDKIYPYSVSTDKIKDSAITEGKIASRAITTDKINESSVTTNKIADYSIITDKIKDLAVTTDKINDSAVSTYKIANNAVTNEKLSVGLQNRLRGLEGEAFTSVRYNSGTGELIFTSTEGKEESVDLPLELIISDGYFDNSEGAEAIILVLANGGTIRIPVATVISNLIDAAENAKNQADQSANKAESEKIAAETAKDAAVVAQKAAETAQSKAESAQSKAAAANTAAQSERVQAEAARVAAEEAKIATEDAVASLDIGITAIDGMLCITFEEET